MLKEAGERARDTHAGAHGTVRYETVAGWLKPPAGYDFFDRHCSAVGTDSKDNLYLFNRGPIPVLVFDRDGNFLRGWGEGQFKRPHGLHVGPDDTLWLVDDGNSVVRQYTLDGKLLTEIGTPGKPAPFMSGRPFNRCTHVAISPKGEIFITDGYGNARVHKFSPDGKRHLASWGEPGVDPGCFNIPHNIGIDKDGWVYVADRMNSRVQIFDENGRYETQWNNMHYPDGMFVTRGPDTLIYIAEMGVEGGPDCINAKVPNIGWRATVNRPDGRRMAAIGGSRMGLGPQEIAGSHGICADSHGDIYVAETKWTSFIKKSPETHHKPQEFRGVHKLVRLAA